MDKLINTDLGGYPFVLDDLRFIDTSIRDTFKGVISAVARPTLTNDGFLFDNTDTLPNITVSEAWTFPETYCYLNGEIYLIPETILNSSPSAGKYYILETNVTYSGTAPGLKVFQDGNSHETYQIRRAKLTYVTSLAGGECVILTGFASLWDYNNTNLYTTRLNDITGNLTYQNKVDTIENTLIVQNLNVAEWDHVIDKTTIPTSLFRNPSSTPSLTGNVAFTTSDMDEVNSHVKVKIIGKTLFCDFNLKSVVLPTYATSPVAGIILKLDNIPGVSITEILKFSSVGRADCNHPTALSGALTIENHDVINNAIILTLDVPHDSSKASFNREYEFLSSTSILVVATASTTHVQTWTLKGSFTAELL